MTKTQIEKKFGVKIRDDGYFTYFGTYIKQYKIYSADGCLWENGMRTLKAVEQECKTWERQLLAIKAKREVL